MSYVQKYRQYMYEANVGLHDLPMDLQELISKFIIAKEAWEENGEPKELLKILVQSDACISAEIFALLRNQTGDADIDKIKMMALKAKALKLKWNLEIRFKP